MAIWLRKSPAGGIPKGMTYWREAIRGLILEQPCLVLREAVQHLDHGGKANSYSTGLCGWTEDAPWPHISLGIANGKRNISTPYDLGILKNRLQFFLHKYIWPIKSSKLDYGHVVMRNDLNKNMGEYLPLRSNCLSHIVLTCQSRAYFSRDSGWHWCSLSVRISREQKYANIHFHRKIWSDNFS